jgi:DNA modification methylase
VGRRKDIDATGFWTLHRCDARNLAGLFENFPQDHPLITATITSPPYGALKDYGHPEQIGFGQHYGQYLEDMRNVFAQVYRRTTEDGSLWLIADTYVEDGPAPTRLLPVPFDLASAAESAGFTLRDVIIWHKDRTLPWSNGTRLRNTFEYVLLLVKGGHPKYRLDRLREHADLKEWWVRFPERYNPNGKAPSNVWHIPIPKQGAWGDGEVAHACPLPPELVRRLILLSSDEGDVVLDPFAGSGVVVAEAERLGRRGIGTELVEQYVDEFHRIIRPEILARQGEARTNGKPPITTAEQLVALRMLKLPVVLMRGAAKQRGQVAWPLGALVLPVKQKLAANRHGAITLIFIVEGTSAQRRSYERSVKPLIAKPPASKFGLDCDLKVVSPEELATLVAGRRIYLYKNGSTSRAAEAVPHRLLLPKLDEARTQSVPPILSSIHIDVAPRPEAALLDDGQAATATS